jgi:hypothetical protein
VRFFKNAWPGGDCERLYDKKYLKAANGKLKPLTRFEHARWKACKHYFSKTRYQQEKYAKARKANREARAEAELREEVDTRLKKENARWKNVKSVLKFQRDYEERRKAKKHAAEVAEAAKKYAADVAEEEAQGDGIYRIGSGRSRGLKHARRYKRTLRSKRRSKHLSRK